MVSGAGLAQTDYFDQPTEVASPIDPSMLPTIPGAPTAISGPGNPLPLDEGAPLFHGTSDVPLLPTQQAAAVSDEPQPIVARTSAGDIRGIILPGAMYYRRPGYAFPQRRYAVLLDDPIAETECGAEILELGTEHTFGYVVQIGRYSRVQVVYAVAIADAFWDVSSRFDEEARNATLWYDKQPRALPLYPGTATGGQGARMGHGMAAEAPPPAFIIQSSDIQGQSGFCYGTGSEHGFQVSITPSATGPPSASGSVKPCLGSPMPALSSTDGRTAMARPGHKKDCQVQFVHYRGANTSAGAAVERSGGLTGKLDSDSDGEQHCLLLTGDDPTDEETPINRLLPDKKCPFQACPYHKKGFARKHDLVRHVITHYDGQLYCGFCPDDLAKSFGRPFLRVEPLKRHLAVVHHAAKFRKTQNTTETYLKLRLKKYGMVHGGHCSICLQQFSAASKLYNHIEGCVVRLLLERARACSGEPQRQDGSPESQMDWVPGAEQQQLPMRRTGGRAEMGT